MRARAAATAGPWLQRDCWWDVGGVRVTSVPSSGTARSAAFPIAELLPNDDTLHKGTGTAVKSETKHQVRACKSVTQRETEQSRPATSQRRSTDWGMQLLRHT